MEIPENSRLSYKTTFDGTEQTIIQETWGSVSRAWQSLGYSSQIEYLADVANRTVLDLGSGEGHTAAEIEQLIGEQRYISVNPRLQYPQHTVDNKARLAVAADWHNLPFPDECFAVIHCRGSWIYYTGTYSGQSRDQVLRVLAPGGQLRTDLHIPSDDAEGRLSYYQQIVDDLNDHGLNARILHTSADAKEYYLLGIKQP